MSLRIGVLGSGQVAQVLAKGFLAEGHTVQIGSRDAGKLAEFSQASGIASATFTDVVATSDVIVLAVKGTAAESLVKQLASGLDGKVILDACNPIEDAPPEEGILRFFTGPNDSLMERLQAVAPGARFVKAFSCVGSGLMVHPKLAGGRPTMFICGNDAEAKATVRGLLEGFGWNSEDVGSVKGARAIEPLCQLWCAAGFLHNDWAHAFTYLRP